MSKLLKEPNLCPPEAKNWKECKIGCGIMLLVELRRRFELPQNESVDRVLLSNFDVKFRTYKHRLKKLLFELAKKRLNEINNIGAQKVHYTDDELLEALDLVKAPDNFLDHQWEMYKSYQRSSMAKKLSYNGKKARAEKLHVHTTGAFSFARKKDEFKLKHKRDANDVEFFGLSHERKNGAYVRDISREFMVQAQKEISRKILEVDNSEPADSEKQSEIERDVMNELMGPNKPGRARGHGPGVTKSQVTKFSFDLIKMRGEALINENRVLLNKVDSQSKQIEAQSKQIESQSKQIESQNKQMRIMENKVDECTGELRLFRTAFPELYRARTQLSSGASREDCQ